MVGRLIHDNGPGLPLQLLQDSGTLLFIPLLRGKKGLKAESPGGKPRHGEGREVAALHNIEIMPHSSLTAVYGNERVEELEFTDNKTGKKQIVKDAECGVFVYAGIVPNTQIYAELKLENGYIPVDELMQTEIPGVFAAGDICVKKVRQIATAVADGAIAGIQAAAMC